MVKDYKELDVFIRCRELVKLVYQVSATFPSSEIYGLTNQYRRCGVSVLSNISEGIGRHTIKDTIHFMHISRGSLYELEAQTIIAFDLKYIDSLNYNLLIEKIEACKRLLNGFIKYQRSLEKN